MRYLNLVILLLTMVGNVDAEERKFKDYELHAEKLIDDFGKQAAKDNDLVFAGGSKAGKLGVLELQFKAYKKANIDEARKLEVTIAEKSAELMNKDEKLKPHLPEPVQPEDVLVQIAFLDSEDHPQVKDSIAFVISRYGTLTFGYINPETKALGETHQETYEEAYKKVKGV